MANFTGTTPVDAAPEAVFAYLADVGNLPRYFARMTSAEAGDGEQVHTTAQLPDGQRVEGTAWFRVDESAHRIEWGSEGPNDYRGYLQVRPAGHPVGEMPAGSTRAEVEVHLHTTRATKGNREVRDGIRKTLAAITEQVEQPARAGAEQAARPAVGGSQEAVSTTADTFGRIARAPVAVAGQLVGELTDGARRPDTVLYWGGLAGAALLGALDWPVAVALGIGVAMASARRSPATPTPGRVTGRASDGPAGSDG